MARNKGAAAQETLGADNTSVGAGGAGGSALMGAGAGGNALARMDHDELADVIGDVDLGTDGLEEADASDVRFAALIWNFKGTDGAGDPIAANRFFNTVTEEVTAEEELALLTLHKSHAWKEFDEAEGKNVTRCSSWDRETGEMDNGTTRKCEGCPDKQWSRDPETGKRKRNCADVNNVIALRLKDGQPAVLRFTKTSERPWKDFLNKHILGKRVVGGKRTNMPLFSHATSISLSMAKGAKGAYAVPVLERAEKPFSREEILYFAESAKGFREGYLDDVRRVAEGAPDDDAGERGAPDTSFDAGSFTDGGDDFAPPPDAGGGDSKRF